MEEMKIHKFTRLSLKDYLLLPIDEQTKYTLVLENQGYAELKDTLVQEMVKNGYRSVSVRVTIR